MIKFNNTNISNVIFNDNQNYFNASNVTNNAFSSTIVVAYSYRGYTIPVNPGDRIVVTRQSTSQCNRFRYCYTKKLPASMVELFTYNETPATAGSYVYDNSLIMDIPVPNASWCKYVALYFSNNNETINNITITIYHKIDKVIFNGAEVFPNAPTPSTLLSYPHSIGTLSRMTQTGTMTFDRYNISSSPVRFTQNDEDDRRGSAVVNFQTVTPSGTLTSAKLYMYGNGSGNGFLEVDIGNIYVGDFILDTTPQERIINLPTGINPNDPITLTLDEANGFYVDINAMKLELNYVGGRMLMGVKKLTRVQEPSYHRYEKLESEVE